jgi:hypothetical protein
MGPPTMTAAPLREGVSWWDSSPRGSMGGASCVPSKGGHAPDEHLGPPPQTHGWCCRGCGGGGGGGGGGYGMVICFAPFAGFFRRPTDHKAMMSTCLPPGSAVARSSFPLVHPQPAARSNSTLCAPPHFPPQPLHPTVRALSRRRTIFDIPHFLWRPILNDDEDDDPLDEPTPSSTTPRRRTDALLRTRPTPGKTKSR